MPLIVKEEGRGIIDIDLIDLDMLIDFLADGNVVRFPTSKMLGEIVERIRREKPQNYFYLAHEWAARGERVIGINRYNHMISSGLAICKEPIRWEDVCHMFICVVLPEIDDLI